MTRQAKHAEDGEDWPHDAPLLHALDHDAHHDPLLLVGTRAALAALRTALDAALRDGQPHQASVMEADGEGYSVVVIPAPAARFDRGGVPFGYRDPDLSALPEGQPYPAWLLTATRAGMQQRSRKWKGRRA